MNTIQSKVVTHTPGPWTCKPFGVPQWDDDPLGVYVIPEVKQKLESADDAATDFVSDDTEYGRRMDAIHAEQQANAKLIAQASAMAEALRRHLDMIEQGGSIVGGYDYQDEMREVLRDAGVLA